MFYYLLSKEDFAALYKFGEVNVKVGAATKSDDPREAVRRLFSTSDSFEYAQERLIVSSEGGSLQTVRMVDVIDIYPLDRISKNLFESQFNADLIFREPIFQDIAEEFLKNTMLKRTTVSGINALRGIFGLDPEKDEELVGDIIKGKTFLRKYKYFDIPLEERTPFSMLIAYNRYQHYPKDSRGFFYDAADCFMYGHMFHSLAEPEEFLGYDRDAVARFCSKFHGLLDSIPSSARFRDIALAVEKSDQKIKDAIAQVYGSVCFMALYLYAKERIRTEETVSLDGIKLLLYIRKEYPTEFPKLVTLLGGFLGYTWIYERLYEFQRCPFLSVHHSLDDFQPTEPVVQKDPVITPSEEATTADASSLEVGQETHPSQPEATAGTSPEAKSEAQEPIASDESVQEESSKSEAKQEIYQEVVAPANADGGTLQPDTEQPPVEIPQPVLDVPNIIRVVFKGCGELRKSAFEAKLKEFYGTVLQLSLEQNVDGLRDIYLRLDSKYDAKNKRDLIRLDDFVKTSLALIYSMD